MRALFIDRQLNIRKIDDMKSDRSCVSGYNPRKIHHLLLCTFTGIRRRMKISCINCDASLRDHPSRDRRIDSPGQAKHGRAIGPKRHTARARKYLRIDVDLIAKLNIHHHLRVMYINTNLSWKCIKNLFPKISVDIHRGNRILLIGPSAVNLE